MREPKAWRTLTDVVGERSRSFLIELHQRREQPLDPERWRQAFSTASRRLGHDALEGPARDRLVAAGIDWALSVDQAARAVLLLELETHVSAEGMPLLLTALFRVGELRERQAILRTLPLLGAPMKLAALATEACRTSILPVFTALAVDNPYPRDHFSDEAYNQLVLKAVVLGVPVLGIRGIGTRGGSELRRMARDYSAELIAAGRDVPADLSLIGV